MSGSQQGHINHIAVAGQVQFLGVPGGTFVVHGDVQVSTEQDLLQLHLQPECTYVGTCRYLSGDLKAIRVRIRLRSTQFPRQRVSFYGLEEPLLLSLTELQPVQDNLEP